MQLSIIVAMADNRVIGCDNTMPWHLPADLKNFKRLTMGKPMLMGRKTFESLGRVLPGREHVIVTRNIQFKPEDCSVFQTLEAALSYLEPHKEVMVIGGATVYEQVLPLADWLYLTRIDHNYPGDTFFPELDFEQWTEIKRQEAVSECFNYRFLILERNRAIVPD